MDSSTAGACISRASSGSWSNKSGLSKSTSLKDLSSVRSWAVGSLLAALELPGINGLGASLVAGQGLAVFALAVLEWVGLRQSGALAAT